MPAAAGAAGFACSSTVLLGNPPGGTCASGSLAFGAGAPLGGIGAVTAGMPIIVRFNAALPGGGAARRSGETGCCVEENGALFPGNASFLLTEDGRASCVARCAGGGGGGALVLPGLSVLNEGGGGGGLDLAG